MTLHGKEKIWFLINTLSDERALISDGEPVGLDPMQDLNNHYKRYDLINLLGKLEEENVARLNHEPTDQTYMKYLIDLLPNFDKYIEKLEEDPEYLEWSGKKYAQKDSLHNKSSLNEINEVDFTLSKEENQSRLLTVGKIVELYKLPRNDRARILRENLTSEQNQGLIGIIFAINKPFGELKDALNKSKVTTGLVKHQGLTNNISHEAESVKILRQLLADSNEKNKPDSNLTSPRYLQKDKMLIFCNQIVDLSKNTDYALLCNSMFRNGNPRLNSPQIGDLLDKWQDPNHANTKRVRNAVTNLNNFIAKHTTITDLFYISDKQVHFNIKYI
jgi:hypothetical protein